MPKERTVSPEDQERWREEYQELQTELEATLQTGAILQGSAVVQRYQRQTKDGAKDCGPYYLWTRKVRGKTVTVSLTVTQFAKVSEAIAIRRKTDKLLKRMQQLSQQLLLGSA